MLRGLIVVSCIVGLVGALVFGPRYLSLNGTSTENTVETCDLDSKSCRWGEGDASWVLELERTGPEATDPLRLNLDLPAGATEGARMVALLEGRSMYMGQYPVVLTPAPATSQEGTGTSRSRLRAEFQAPLCTVDREDMAWKITLQRGTEAVSMPVIPTFQTVPAS
ncbi:hypothetical protein [Marinobacter fonticola]|uniref:hypothetical protein n=1 Tax=Marinobacter fonticola TaxID=2603215 RepID=UPI0011E698AB|nr:hypothetical protein [Marinobacter fonticola]